MEEHSYNINTFYNFDYNNPESILYIACDIGNKSLVKCLLTDSNINVNNIAENSYSPLSVACYNGFEEIVKLLVKQSNINLDIYDNVGHMWTPLHFCAFSENEDAYECAKILLENGANPNIEDYKGYTPDMNHKCSDKLRHLLCSYIAKRTKRAKK